MIIVMIVIMMVVITIMMATIMIAIVAIAWEYAAAQQADHRCGEDKEQNTFHHEIGGVLSLVCCRDAIVPAFRSKQDSLSR
jgi:hypothetical protein